MRIQHNIMAMNAYRNYNNNTSALSSNLEKLSSGYKINRAGDDAAGLAISEKMRAQITGLDQAADNVKDGISLVKTAEGALQEVQDMLNRMVELATQSANGTYEDSVDRDNLQKEVNELTAEIDRIADSSNFNGIQLLDGSLEDGATVGGGNLDISANLTATARDSGTQANKQIFTVSLDGYKAIAADTNDNKWTITIGDASGTNYTVTSATAKTAAAAKDEISAADIAGTFANTKITVNNLDYEVTVSGTTLTFTAKDNPTAANQLVTDLNVSIATGSGNATAADGASINLAAQNIQTGAVATPSTQATGKLKLTTEMLADGNQINIGTQTINIDYSSNFTDTSTNTVGVKDLLNDEGKLDASKISEVADRITKVSANAAAQASAGVTIFSVGHDGAGTLTFQSLTTNSDDLSTVEKVKAQISVTQKATTGSALTLQIGDTSASYNQLNVSISDMHAESLGVGSQISIADQTSAQEAISTIKKAINTVSSVRGTLGATQNRLEHTSNNLSVMSENIQDAESTIRDTDIAEEMMSYTKNNILVQSAQAMLAQANQVPQGVLQLLQ